MKKIFSILVILSILFVLSACDQQVGQAKLMPAAHEIVIEPKTILEGKLISNGNINLVQFYPSREEVDIFYNDGKTLIPYTVKLFKSGSGFYQGQWILKGEVIELSIDYFRKEMMFKMPTGIKQILLEQKNIYEGNLVLDGELHKVQFDPMNGINIFYNFKTYFKHYQIIVRSTSGNTYSATWVLEGQKIPIKIDLNKNIMKFEVKGPTRRISRTDTRTPLPKSPVHEIIMESKNIYEGNLMLGGELHKVQFDTSTLKINILYNYGNYFKPFEVLANQISKYTYTATWILEGKQVPIEFDTKTRVMKFGI